MQKYNLQSNKTGKFFVLGEGFTACTKAGASALTPAQVASAQNAGFEPSTAVAIPMHKSFAVVYIRKGDVVNGELNKQAPNAGLGQVDPSKRRFADEDEAIQHGSRFKARRADRGDEPGTAGHRGFYVVETTDPVNAKVNWKTGLTNPVK